MGEILGIGCSHGPGLVGSWKRLTDIYLTKNLASELTPAHMKDPANWPARMRAEWSDDEGQAFALQYQATLQPAYRAARAALDAFQPDFVVIFGDDQYEVFKEDCLPPFCVFAVPEVECHGRGDVPGRLVRGHQEGGNHLARELIHGGFEVACSWRIGNGGGYGHAFTTTLQYLDLDARGFDYPVVPISVNCYGGDLRVPTAQHPNPSQMGRRMENVAMPPPPSPPPWRCYDLGKQVAQIIEQSLYRVAIIGSSSWSHASLTTKHHYLWPDVEADRQRFEELQGGRLHTWRDLDPAQIRDSGQHEILNWVCLAGAMEGRRAEILAYAECHIFNSNKCVALFPVE